MGGRGRSQHRTQFPPRESVSLPQSLSRFRVGWGEKGAGWGRSEKFLPDPGGDAQTSRGAAGSAPARAQVGWARASAQLAKFRGRAGPGWARGPGEGAGCVWRGDSGSIPDTTFPTSRRPDSVHRDN